MQLSSYLVVSATGVLVYLGQFGKLHEVVGFSQDGTFKLRSME